MINAGAYRPLALCGTATAVGVIPAVGGALERWLGRGGWHCHRSSFFTGSIASGFVDAEAKGRFACEGIVPTETLNPGTGQDDLPPPLAPF